MTVGDYRPQDWHTGFDARSSIELFGAKSESVAELAAGNSKDVCIGVGWQLISVEGADNHSVVQPDRRNQDHAGSLLLLGSHHCCDDDL